MRAVMSLNSSYRCLNSSSGHFFIDLCATSCAKVSVTLTQSRAFDLPSVWENWRLLLQDNCWYESEAECSSLLKSWVISKREEKSSLTSSALIVIIIYLWCSSHFRSCFGIRWYFLFRRFHLLLPVAHFILYSHMLTFIWPCFGENHCKYRVFWNACGHARITKQA